MWQADPTFWGWTAPVLSLLSELSGTGIPFRGKTYHMPQHGFARQVNLSINRWKEANSVLSLRKVGYTQRLSFLLSSGGRLYASRTVGQWMEVLNTGEKRCIFSIGAHPAFNCPPTQACRKNVCLLSFNAQDKLTATLLNLKVGNVSDQTMDVALKDGMLPVPMIFLILTR